MTSFSYRSGLNKVLWYIQLHKQSYNRKKDSIFCINKKSSNWNWVKTLLFSVLYNIEKLIKLRNMGSQYLFDYLVILHLCLWRVWREGKEGSGMCALYRFYWIWNLHAIVANLDHDVRSFSAFVISIFQFSRLKRAY